MTTKMSGTTKKIDPDEIKVFALGSSKQFGERVVKHLDLKLSEHEEEKFDDGETKDFSLENVRGKDVFVIQSLFEDQKSSVNDKIYRLLNFTRSLVDASAGRITGVFPYLAYDRQDRKVRSREPVNTKALAIQLEAAGCDRVLGFDVHNLAAFQNAFRIPSDHLEAKYILAGYYAKHFGEEKLAVICPDAGGMPRARLFRRSLLQLTNKKSIPLVFFDKEHDGREIRGSRIVGDIEGYTTIIVDDMISSGSTIFHAANAAKKAGAKAVFAATTHGLFVGNANSYFSSKNIDQVTVTDTIEPFRLNRNIREQKLVVLPTTSFFAEAIKRIHLSESISSLLRLESW